MVGFLQSPTSQEDKENQNGYQSFPDLKKQDNPSEYSFTVPEDEFSVAFADSLLNFDWIEEGPESFSSMATDGLGENPSGISLENAEVGAFEERIEVGCNGFRKRSGVEEGSVEEKVGKLGELVFKGEEKGVEGCGDIGHEKNFVPVGTVGDETGKSDELRCMIEEDMGKISLGDVSGASVSIIGNGRREESEVVCVNENGMKGSGFSGVSGSDNPKIGKGDGDELKSIVARDEAASHNYGSDDSVSEKEKEISAPYSATSISSNDDKEEKDEEGRDGKRKGETRLRRGGGGDDYNDDSYEGEAEMEEGEIIASEIDEMVAWSCDEDGEDGDGGINPVGPIRSKNELMVLPPVPPVNVTLQAHHQTLPVGFVLSIVGPQVIVEGIEKHNPLDEGSILWITRDRYPLGIVDEIFGPVKNPYYVIRYNSESEVPTRVQPGDSVCFVPEFANHILNDKSLYEKAYDASGVNDEELTGEEEFSDDEKEAEFRRMLKMKKRGSNHENVGNNKMERRKLKNRSRSWKHDCAPLSQREVQANQLREDQQHPDPPVAPKPGLHNGPCSSNLGHDLGAQPGFAPPLLGPRPGFTMPSDGANRIPFLPPQNNIGFVGLPSNNIPLLQQVNPQLLYQMNMHNGLALQQQIGTTANLPPTPVFPGGQPGFGVAPAFAPWPFSLGQNFFNPSVLGMGAHNRHIPFAMNVEQQMFPTNKQMGPNSDINPGLATAGKPDTLHSSSNIVSGQNLFNPSHIGMAAPGKRLSLPVNFAKCAFPSNIQQSGYNSGAMPDLATSSKPDTIPPSSNQGFGQNKFKSSPFGMAAPGGQIPDPINVGEQAFPSSSVQHMEFNSTVKPDIATSPKHDIFLGSNPGRSGGRKPYRRSRGGGRFGCVRGRQRSD